jgi:hypothetical protein
MTNRPQLSGESPVLPVRLMPAGRVAIALGVAMRTLDRLIARGVLPQPVMMSGRRLWPADVVERVRQARLSHRPTNRHHARKGPAAARRIRFERRVLAFALLDVLNDCGAVVLIDALRRHGATERWRSLSIGQLAALVAELHEMSRLVRGLGR